jgi:hypothetical protein
MPLTKEYLDEQLTKLSVQIDDRFEKQTQLLMGHSEEQIDKLAGMVRDGFEDMQEKDMTERVMQIENDMKKIKEALHV